MLLYYSLPNHSLILFLAKSCNGFTLHISKKEKKGRERTCNKVERKKSCCSDVHPLHFSQNLWCKENHNFPLPFQFSWCFCCFLSKNWKIYKELYVFHICLFLLGSRSWEIQDPRWFVCAWVFYAVFTTQSIGKLLILCIIHIFNEKIPEKGLCLARSSFLGFYPNGTLPFFGFASARCEWWLWGLWWKWTKFSLN